MSTHVQDFQFSSLLIVVAYKLTTIASASNNSKLVALAMRPRPGAASLADSMLRLSLVLIVGQCLQPKPVGLP